MTLTDAVSTDPLAPLTAVEIETLVALLRDRHGLDVRHRFVRVDLLEPSKEVIAKWRPGDPVDRCGLAVLLDRSANATYEAVVSVTDREVRSFEQIPGVQPEVMADEFEEAERAVKDSPLFQEALAKRGIDDVDSLCVDPWSAGSYGTDDRNRRLMRCLAWVRLDGPDDNCYAHPIDNLTAIVDLNTMEVVEVEDYGVVSVPREPGNYSPDAVGGLRTDLRPLDVVQPDGPSFTVDGHVVAWQKWRFRIGWTHREGLVLHTITYQDGNEERSILHRAALSSMLVPYGDPRPAQYRKNAFDAGEYGLGYLANSLELGCDCLGEIRYLDATLCDSQGRPYTIRNAICIHEEDDGILWKHMDFRTQYTEVRRSRRLVVSVIATVGNYEYAFYWRFYQDGSLEHDIRLTGILSTAAVEPGERPPFGQLLNREGLYGALHQHFFNYRLDFDLDGVDNAVYEVDTVRLDPNPHGNGQQPVETLLRTEMEARRTADASRDRFWKIVNHRRRNAVGDPTAFRLVPRSATLPYWTDDAHISPRGRFCSKHLWVTAHEPTELYAAGTYPYQNPTAGGLPEWTERDRDIVDTDVVVWYTFGAHHIPRLEDWPVMPVQHVGFKLEPVGFFDRNPALDVPPPNGRCHDAPEA
jgi:primary-amine oxidase